MSEQPSILYIEDNIDNQRLVSRILQARGSKHHDPFVRMKRWYTAERDRCHATSKCGQPLPETPACDHVSSPRWIGLVLHSAGCLRVIYNEI